MDSRTGNIQYRSVPLIQRGDMARIGAEAAARRAASDAADRERSRRREDRWSDRDEDVERTLPRRRPTASPRGSAWERSASDVEVVPQPRREHVSAYLDESSVVRVTRRSERTRSYGFGAAREDDRYRDDGRRDDRYFDDRPASRGRRFSLVDDDYQDAYRPEAQRSRASYAWRDEQASAAYDDRREDRYAEEFDDYDDYNEFDEYDGYDEYDEEDDYFYDERPSLFSLIGQGLQGILGFVIAIPHTLVSGLVSAVRHVHLRGLLVLGGLAVAGLMLYAPVRDLYLASRRLDTLQATYDVLLEENNQIRKELETLQTRDGIENEARARGYVEPGETKVVVEGLTQAEDPATAYMIEDIELPDDRAWYIRILDELFGYNPEA